VIECEFETLAGKLRAEKLKEIGQVSRLLRDLKEIGNEARTGTIEKGEGKNESAVGYELVVILHG
jgi:hypothetical protein